MRERDRHDIKKITYVMSILSRSESVKNSVLRISFIFNGVTFQAMNQTANWGAFYPIILAVWLSNVLIAFDLLS